MSFSIVFYLFIFLLSFYVLRVFFKNAILLSFSFAVIYFISLYLRKLEGSRLNYTFVHHFASIWLGFLWIAGATTFFLDALSVVSPFSATKSMYLYGLVFSMAVSLIAYINNKSIFVREFTVPSSKITKPLTVAHISDLHINGSRSKVDFERIIAQVISQNPDVIVITGDLVDIPAVPAKSCFDILYQIKTPILFVTGNHDYYAGVNYTCSMLKERGVTVLRGNKRVVKGVCFVGFDDPTGGKTLAKELDSITLSEKQFSVLLYHQPRDIKLASKKGFDLMLSGHTHAGQLFPFNLFVKLQFKYVVGLHKIENMLLYIIPGTGTWEIPMRFGSRNTIALFRLEPVSK